MPRPVHFDIFAADPERAQRFYTALFGWRFERWGGLMPYWLITTGDDGPGINGGLAQRPGPNPDPQMEMPVVAWTCTVQVDDPGRGLVGLLQGHREQRLRPHAGRSRGGLGREHCAESRVKRDPHPLAGRGRDRSEHVRMSHDAARAQMQVDVPAGEP